MSEVNEGLREALEQTIGPLAQLYPAAHEDLNDVLDPEISEEELEEKAREYRIDPSQYQGFGR